MKHLHTFTIISVLVFLLCVTPTAIFAQAPEASGSGSANEISESPELTTQNLKERIERVVQEKKEAIKGAIDRMGTQKRGFIGEVQRISEETLTVRTNKGIRIVALNDPNITILKDSKPIKLESIVVGDWVVAMGFSEEDGTFTPRRLLLSSETLRPQDYKVDIGTITEIGRNTITFTSRQDVNPQQLTIAKTTTLEDVEGEEIALTDITTDLQVLVIGYDDTANNNQRVIKVVRVLSDITPDN